MKFKFKYFDIIFRELPKTFKPKVITFKYNCLLNFYKTSQYIYKQFMTMIDYQVNLWTNCESQLFP